MSLSAPVSDYMSSHPLTLRASDSPATATEVFVSNRFTIAPVVDERGRTLGVVSASDLLQTEASTLSELLSGRVYSISPSDSIVEAAVMMTDLEIHHLIVLDLNDHPVGVLSNLDVARAVVDAGIEQPVRYVMCEEIATIELDATPEEAANLLEDSGIGAAPVLEGGRVIGMVSKLALLGSDGEAERVADMMSREVHTATPNTTISEVAAILVEEGARRVFILDEVDELVGVVTATDIAGFAATFLEEGVGVTA